MTYSCRKMPCLKWDGAFAWVTNSSDCRFELYVEWISGGSRPGVWGGSQIGGRQNCLHLLSYQRLSATKEVIFCRSKSGYFCWSNYAIFQGITTIWKRFVSLIQKTFEPGSQATQISYIYKIKILCIRKSVKRTIKVVRAKRLASAWQLKMSGSFSRELDQYSYND